MRGTDILELSAALDRVKINLGALIKSKEIESKLYNLEIVAVFPQSWANTSCGFGFVDAKFRQRIWEQYKEEIVILLNQDLVKENKRLKDKLDLYLNSERDYFRAFK